MMIIAAGIFSKSSLPSSEIERKFKMWSLISEELVQETN